MGSATTWVRSFGVSIAIHAIVLAGLHDRTVRGTTDPALHTLLPVRIVWTEPAPVVPGVPPAPVPAVMAAVPPETPARVATVTERRSEPSRRFVQARSKRSDSSPRLPAPGAEKGASAAEPTGVALGAAISAGADTDTGTGAGAGTDDAPLALATVARRPELVERVLPEYPPRARALELEGQVVLEVVLDREGRPEPGIRVLRSQPLFDTAAVAAVRRWRFRPARDAGGRAVRVVIEVPVRFELR